MENKDINTAGRAEVVVEEEEHGYKNLLDKFEQPCDNKSKKKKNGHIRALLVSIAGAAVLAGLVLLLIFLPRGSGEEENAAAQASITSKTDSDNVWQATLKTDKNGKIKSNGSGSLMKYVPADISKIELENKKGSMTVTSYTPSVTTSETDPDTGEKVSETDSTVYTVVGYENFDLQPGIADEIASACSSVEFSTVVEADGSGKLKDYGFDKPRCVATVTYDDKTKAIITVGADAPQKLGTYVMFGSGSEIYLCESDAVSALLYGVSDLMSLTVNNSASDTESSDFSYLNLTGSAFREKLTLKPNGDAEHNSSAYVLTAPKKVYADDTEASNVAGAVRGLYADSVVCVNPTAKQLEKYGLSSQYAHLVAKYPDITVNLIASKPDEKGNCFLMKNGDNVIYKIASSSIPWVTTSFDKLESKYIINPKVTGLSGMSVTCNSKTYDFSIKTTVTQTTDDSGSATSSTTTVTKYKGNELTQGNFEIFLQNVSLMTKSDASGAAPTGSPQLTVKYTYSGGKNADTVKFYKGDGSKYIVTLNSKTVGAVYAAYVNKLTEQAPRVAKDKEVKTFW